MARAVKRFGRGLNSFSYRAEYGGIKKREISKSMYAANDPERYFVSSVVSGEFMVIDRNTGKPAATQLESREEAQSWITYALGQGLAKTG